jgi:hypothetical protein
VTLHRRFLDACDADGSLAVVASGRDHPLS